MKKIFFLILVFTQIFFVIFGMVNVLSEKIDRFSGLPLHPSYTLSSSREIVKPFFCPDSTMCYTRVTTFMTSELNLPEAYNWFFEHVPANIRPSGHDMGFAENCGEGKYCYKIPLVVNNKTFFVDFEFLDPSTSLSIIEPGKTYEWPSDVMSRQDWKTYTTNEENISLMYPEDWIKEGDTLYLYSKESCGEVCAGMRPYFTVRQVANNSTSVREYVEKTVLNQPASGVMISNIPPKLALYDVVVVAGIPGANSPGPNLYLAHNNMIFIIESDGIELDTLSQIFASIEIK